MFNKHLRLAWASLLNIAVITAFVASLVFAALPVTTVQAAAVITVTTTQDVFNTDGKCSLREAIISANKDKAPNTGKGECTAGNRDDTNRRCALAPDGRAPSCWLPEPIP